MKKDIEYQFVAVPLNLFCRLDNNLRSMLFVLIQLQTYYADEDGWFFRSNEDLKAQSNLSENLVRVTTDMLYKEGLIDVESVGKGKGSNSPSNRYKVNWERFKDYEKDDIEMCIKDPRLEIKTPQYKGSHYHPSYLDKKDIELTTETVIIDAQVNDKVNDKVDDKVNDKVDDKVKKMVNIEDNIYNIKNDNNIENKENTENKINIDNSSINNNFDYSIYKDWSTYKESFPEKMDISEYQIKHLIFELSQQTDFYSTRKKLYELTPRLYKRNEKKLIEEAKNVLQYKCDELSISYDSILE